MKRMVARGLDWHVREQVEFNRAVVGCVQSTLEALNECNRTMVAISARIDRMGGASGELRDEVQQLKDIRSHWVQWREEWERKLANNEIHFLRSVSELQGAFQHRVTMMDASQREQSKMQHANFEAALERTSAEMQKSVWENFDRIRAEYEAIIHSELRLLRQKASLVKTAKSTVATAPVEFENVDWLKFAEKFRGSEENVKGRQRMYAARFQGTANVLDIGCGRGELLEVLKEAGIPARGIDLHEDSLALCRSKGLEVEKADLFSYLEGLADSELGGVVCCQVVEHLPPERLPELVRLAHAKLKKGALLAIETPNPECLAIFATHFYLDPTHRHPIPAALMRFYLEEAGFGRVEVERLFRAVESMASLAELTEGFRKEFFGGLDYVVFGRKL